MPYHLSLERPYADETKVAKHFWLSFLAGFNRQNHKRARGLTPFSNNRACRRDMGMQTAEQGTEGNAEPGAYGSSYTR